MGNPKARAITQYRWFLTGLGIIHLTAAAICFLYPEQVRLGVNFVPDQFAVHHPLAEMKDLFWVTTAALFLFNVGVLYLVAARFAHYKSPGVIILCSKLLAIAAFYFRFQTHEQVFAYLVFGAFDVFVSVFMFYFIVRIAISKTEDVFPGGFKPAKPEVAGVGAAGLTTAASAAAESESEEIEESTATVSVEEPKSEGEGPAPDPPPSFELEEEKPAPAPKPEQAPAPAIEMPAPEPSPPDSNEEIRGKPVDELTLSGIDKPESDGPTEAMDVSGDAIPKPPNANDIEEKESTLELPSDQVREGLSIDSEPDNEEEESIVMPDETSDAFKPNEDSQNDENPQEIDLSIELEDHTRSKK